jgi:biotin transport system substrate-specific component
MKFDMANVQTEMAAASYPWVKELLIVLGGSLLVALLSQIRMRLPFTPVPFTCQTQGVLLVAAMCGGRRAFLAILVYLLGGFCGAPVFAGGDGGIMILLYPSAGYLLSYLPVSYFVGRLFEKQTGLPSRIGILFFGYAMVLVGGATVLSFHVGIKNAWPLGIAPFLLTGVIKTLMNCACLPVTSRVARWVA